MRALFALLLAAPGVACMPVGDYDCAHLADELERCDLPPANLACLRLEDTERKLLIERLEDMACDVTGELYDDDPDLPICELLDWRCPEPLFSPPAPQRTENIIVLVGGIDDDPALSWSPRVVQAIADAALNEVVVVQPSPWAVTEVRAEELYLDLWQIHATRDFARLNLICWAVGGLDCRALVSPGGVFADRPEVADRAASIVASITTVGTPHRGTNVAEAALELVDGDAAALLDALGASGLDRPDDTRLEASLRGLTPARMREKNRTMVDHPDVPIFSWAGVSHPFGQPYVPSEGEIAAACTDAQGNLRWARSGDGYDVLAAPLLAAAPFAGDLPGDDAGALLRASDGMIPVSSARWGEFRGCVPADHYDLIGQIGDTGPDPSSGFDAAVFYQNVVVDLARRGL